MISLTRIASVLLITYYNIVINLVQVSTFIKTCQEQIDILKNSINQEEETSKGWLGIATTKSNADVIAHKHGVVRTSCAC